MLDVVMLIRYPVLYGKACMGGGGGSSSLWGEGEASPAPLPPLD